MNYGLEGGEDVLGLSTSIIPSIGLTRDVFVRTSPIVPMTEGNSRDLGTHSPFDFQKGQIKVCLGLESTASVTDTQGR